MFSKNTLCSILRQVVKFKVELEDKNFVVHFKKEL